MNWRDIDKLVPTYEEMEAVNKFMIYIEFEASFDLTDEAEDYILDVAHNFRQDADYATATGVGIAVLNALYHITDELDLEDEEHNVDYYKLSQAILAMEESQLKQYIEDAWTFGDGWQ